MASYNRQIQLQFTADVSSAQKAMQTLSKDLKNVTSLQFSGSGMNQQLNTAIKSAKTLQTVLQNSVNMDTGNLNLNHFVNQLNKAGLSVQQLGANLAGAGKVGAAAFSSLTQAIAHSEAPVRQLNGLLGQMATSLANTVKWQISSSAIHAVISGFSSAVRYAKDLNSSLNDIRIVTGQSVDDMARFAKQANEAAKALSTTTNAYAQASLIYYQQGDSAEQAAKKAAITIKAANASFGSSAEEMSEYLTAVWNSYQVGADELERYVDIMAALGAKTATSLEEIATSMQKVAATANTVGVSMEEVSSIISTVSSVTRESAESIGTSFKTIFARIGDLKLGETLEDGVGLGQVSSALKKINVEVLDSAGNMREMGDIITDLGDRWQTLSQAQKTATAQVVAGKRQYTQLMALFENWDMYNKNLEISINADGSLQDMADTYAESWEAASAKVRASWEGIWKQIFNDEAIIDFTNGLADVIDTIGSLIESLGGIKGTISTIGSILVTVFRNNITRSIESAIVSFQQFKNSFQDMPFGQKIKSFFTESSYERNIRRTTQQADAGLVMARTRHTNNASNAALSRDVRFTEQILVAEIDKQRELLAVKQNNTLQSKIMTKSQIADGQERISQIEQEISRLQQLRQNYSEQAMAADQAYATLMSNSHARAITGINDPAAANAMRNQMARDAMTNASFFTTPKEGVGNEFGVMIQQFQQTTSSAAILAGQIDVVDSALDQLHNGGQSTSQLTTLLDQYITKLNQIAEAARAIGNDAEAEGMEQKAEEAQNTREQVANSNDADARDLTQDFFDTEKQDAADAQTFVKVQLAEQSQVLTNQLGVEESALHQCSAATTEKANTAMQAAGATEREASASERAAAAQKKLALERAKAARAATSATTVIQAGMMAMNAYNQVFAIFSDNEKSVGDKISGMISLVLTLSMTVITAGSALISAFASVENGIRLSAPVVYAILAGVALVAVGIAAWTASIEAERKRQEEASASATEAAKKQTKALEDEVKAQQDLLKQMQDLWEQQKAGEDVTVDLAKSAMELAAAYNIVGDALTKLTTSYEDYYAVLAGGVLENSVTEAEANVQTAAAALQNDYIWSGLTDGIKRDEVHQIESEHTYQEAQALGYGGARGGFLEYNTWANMSLDDSVGDGRTIEQYLDASGARKYFTTDYYMENELALLVSNNDSAEYLAGMYHSLEELYKELESDGQETSSFGKMVKAHIDAMKDEVENYEQALEILQSTKLNTIKITQTQKTLQSDLDFSTLYQEVWNEVAEVINAQFKQKYGVDKSKWDMDEYNIAMELAMQEVFSLNDTLTSFANGYTILLRKANYNISEATKHWNNIVLSFDEYKIKGLSAKDIDAEMVNMYDMTGGTGTQWGSYLLSRETQAILSTMEELTKKIESLEMSEDMSYDNLNTFYEEYTALRQTLIDEFGIELKTFDELMLLPLQERLAYIQGLKDGSYDRLLTESQQRLSTAQAEAAQYWNADGSLIFNPQFATLNPTSATTLQNVTYDQWQLYDNIQADLTAAWTELLEKMFISDGAGGYKQNPLFQVITDENKLVTGFSYNGQTITDHDLYALLSHPTLFQLVQDWGAGRQPSGTYMDANYRSEIIAQLALDRVMGGSQGVAGSDVRAARATTVAYETQANTAKENVSSLEQMISVLIAFTNQVDSAATFIEKLSSAISNLPENLEDFIKIAEKLGMTLQGLANSSSLERAQAYIDNIAQIRPTEEQFTVASYNNLFDGTSITESEYALLDPSMQFAYIRGTTIDWAAYASAMEEWTKGQSTAVKLLSEEDVSLIKTYNTAISALTNSYKTFLQTGEINASTRKSLLTAGIDPESIQSVEDYEEAILSLNSAMQESANNLQIILQNATEDLEVDIDWSKMDVSTTWVDFVAAQTEEVQKYLLSDEGSWIATFYEQWRTSMVSAATALDGFNTASVQSSVALDQLSNTLKKQQKEWEDTAKAIESAENAIKSLSEGSENITFETIAQLKQDILDAGLAIEDFENYLYILTSSSYSTEDKNAAMRMLQNQLQLRNVEMAYEQAAPYLGSTTLKIDSYLVGGQRQSSPIQSEYVTNIDSTITGTDEAKGFGEEAKQIMEDALSGGNKKSVSYSGGVTDTGSGSSFDWTDDAWTLANKLDNGDDGGSAVYNTSFTVSGNGSSIVMSTDAWSIVELIDGAGEDGLGGNATYEVILKDGTPEGQRIGDLSLSEWWLISNWDSIVGDGTKLPAEFVIRLAENNMPENWDTYVDDVIAALQDAIDKKQNEKIVLLKFLMRAAPFLDESDANPFDWAYLTNEAGEFINEQGEVLKEGEKPIINLGKIGVVYTFVNADPTKSPREKLMSELWEIVDTDGDGNPDAAKLGVMHYAIDAIYDYDEATQQYTVKPNWAEEILDEEGNFKTAYRIYWEYINTKNPDFAGTYLSFFNNANDADLEKIYWAYEYDDDNSDDPTGMLQWNINYATPDSAVDQVLTDLLTSMGLTEEHEQYNQIYGLGLSFIRSQDFDDTTLKDANAIKAKLREAYGEDWMSQIGQNFLIKIPVELTGDPEGQLAGIVGHMQGQTVFINAQVRFPEGHLLNSLSGIYNDKAFIRSAEGSEALSGILPNIPELVFTTIGMEMGISRQSIMDKITGGDFEGAWNDLIAVLFKDAQNGDFSFARGGISPDGSTSYSHVYQMPSVALAERRYRQYANGEITETEYLDDITHMYWNLSGQFVDLMNNPEFAGSNLFKFIAANNGTIPANLIEAFDFSNSGLDTILNNLGILFNPNSPIQLEERQARLQHLMLQFNTLPVELQNWVLGKLTEQPERFFPDSLVSTNDYPRLKWMFTPEIMQQLWLNGMPYSVLAGIAKNTFSSEQLADLYLNGSLSGMDEELLPHLLLQKGNTFGRQASDMNPSYQQALVALVAEGEDGKLRDFDKVIPLLKSEGAFNVLNYALLRDYYFAMGGETWKQNEGSFDEVWTTLLANSPEFKSGEGDVYDPGQVILNWVLNDNMPTAWATLFRQQPDLLDGLFWNNGDDFTEAYVADYVDHYDQNGSEIPYSLPDGVEWNHLLGTLQQIPEEDIPASLKSLLALIVNADPSLDFLYSLDNNVWEPLLLSLSSGGLDDNTYDMLASLFANPDLVEFLQNIDGVDSRWLSDMSQLMHAVTLTDEEWVNDVFLGQLLNESGTGTDAPPVSHDSWYYGRVNAESVHYNPETNNFDPNATVLFLPKILSWFHSEVSRAITNGEQASPEMIRVATWLKYGLFDGLETWPAELAALLQNLNLGGITEDILNSMFEIASPSHLTQRIGMWIMLGLQKGIDDNSAINFDAAKDSAMASLMSLEQYIINGMKDMKIKDVLSYMFQGMGMEQANKLFEVNEQHTMEDIEGFWDKNYRAYANTYLHGLGGDLSFEGFKNDTDDRRNAIAQKLGLGTIDWTEIEQGNEAYTKLEADFYKAYEDYLNSWKDISMFGEAALAMLFDPTTDYHYSKNSNLSPMIQAAFDQTFKAVKEANTNWFDSNGNILDQFQDEFNTAFWKEWETTGTNAITQVQKEWQKLKDGWTGAFTAYLNKTKEVNQQALEVWKTTVNSILKLHKGLKEGLSIKEILGDNETDLQNWVTHMSSLGQNYYQMAQIYYGAASLPSNATALSNMSMTDYSTKHYSSGLSVGIAYNPSTGMPIKQSMALANKRIEAYYNTEAGRTAIRQEMGTTLEGAIDKYTAALASKNDTEISKWTAIIETLVQSDLVRFNSTTKEYEVAKNADGKISDDVIKEIVRLGLLGQGFNSEAEYTDYLNKEFVSWLQHSNQLYSGYTQEWNSAITQNTSDIAILEKVKTGGEGSLSWDEFRRYRQIIADSQYTGMATQDIIDFMQNNTAEARDNILATDAYLARGWFLQEGPNGMYWAKHTDSYGDASIPIISDSSTDLTSLYSQFGITEATFAGKTFTPSSTAQGVEVKASDWTDNGSGGQVQYTITKTTGTDGKPSYQISTQTRNKTAVAVDEDELETVAEAAATDYDAKVELNNKIANVEPRLTAISGIKDLERGDEGWGAAISSLREAFAEDQNALAVIEQLNAGAITWEEANIRLTSATLLSRDSIIQMAEAQWKQYQATLAQNGVMVDGYETLEDYFSALDNIRKIQGKIATWSTKTTKYLNEQDKAWKAAKETAEDYSDDLAVLGKIIKKIDLKKEFGIEFKDGADPAAVSKALGELAENYQDKIGDINDVLNQDSISEAGIGWDTLLDIQGLVDADTTFREATELVLQDLSITDQNIINTLASIGGAEFTPVYGLMATILGSVDPAQYNTVAQALMAWASEMGVELDLPLLDETATVNSGGGGGGGGGGKKKPTERKKYSEVERYHEIEGTTKAIEDEMSKIEKMRERSFGPEKLEILKAELALLEKQKEAQEVLLAEANTWLESDKQILESLIDGIEYTTDGRIANWSEIQHQLIDEYNAAVAAADEIKDDEKKQEAIDAAQKEYDRKVEALEQYEESLNKVSEAEQALQNSINERSAKKLEAIQYEVEYKIQFNESELEILEYYLDTYEDDIFKSAESMDNMIKQINVNLESLAAYKDEYYKLLEAHEKGEITDADFQSELKEVQSSIIDTLSELNDLKKEMEEFYEDVLDNASKELENHTEKLDAIVETMESYISIQELMGKGVNYEWVTGIYQTQYEANRALLTANKEYLDNLIKARDEATNPDLIEAYNDAIVEANKSLLESTEAVLETLQKIYENTVANIFETLDKSLAGAADSVEELSEDYAYYQEVQERYVSTAKELHEVSKLNRDIEKSINETASQTNKNLLKQLQERIKAQSKMNELTQYDLDMNQKQYELLLAKIALEEAQNAKDTVRLVRDANGNYAYQYTADQGKIDEAEQQYEDALYAIHELSAERIKEMEQEMIDARQTFLDSAKEIAEAEYDSEDERYEDLLKLFDQYKERMTYSYTEYEEATDHLGVNAQSFAELFGVSVDEIYGGSSLMNEALDALFALGTDATFEDAWTAIQAVMQAAKEREDAVKDATDEAGTSLDGMSGNADQAGGAIGGLIGEITDLNTKLGAEFIEVNKVADAWLRLHETLSSASLDYEQIAESMQRLQEVIGTDGLGLILGDIIINGDTMAGVQDTEDQLGYYDDKGEYHLYATGGLVDYTGPAWVDGTPDKPELMLNATDTPRFLEAVKIARQINFRRGFGDSSVGQYANIISDTLEASMAAMYDVMANSYHATDSAFRILSAIKSEPIDQVVTIDAHFPSVTNHTEIEDALNNLINQASHFTNRNF